MFNSIPSSYRNQSDEPTIPADALPDVLRQFSLLYGVELLTDNEMEMLRMLLATNQGIEVTPQVLLQFIAERTRHSPRGSPGKDTNACAQQPSLLDSPQNLPAAEDDDVTLHSNRGRALAGGASSSRSSSRSSADTSYLPSRPPSVPPKTPINAPPSAFDTTRRQRTTPLSGTAPSSWPRRPAPASRRKSVDGGSNRALSDTEVTSFVAGTKRPVLTSQIFNDTVILFHEPNFIWAAIGSQPGSFKSNQSSLGSYITNITQLSIFSTSFPHTITTIKRDWLPLYFTRSRSRPTFPKPHVSRTLI